MQVPGANRCTARMKPPYYVGMRKRGAGTVGIAAACLGLAIAGAAGFRPSLAVLAASAWQAPPISFNREILPILAEQLLRLPRSGRKAARDQVPLRHRGRRVRQAGRDRAGQRRREPADRARSPIPIRTQQHAAARLRPRADRRSRSTCCAGGSTKARSGTRTGPTRRRRVPNRRRSATPAGCAIPIDRFILARLEREGLKPSPEADKDDAAAPRHLRPDRTAADAGRGRRVPRRPVARRLREAGRRAAAVAALRRADGDAVARRGALRRHARLPHRQPARHVALARLGDRRLQPQPAVRPVRDRAAGRRPAARTPRAIRRSPRASTATT